MRNLDETVIPRPQTSDLANKSSGGSCGMRWRRSVCLDRVVGLAGLQAMVELAEHAVVEVAQGCGVAVALYEAVCRAPQGAYALPYGRLPWRGWSAPAKAGGKGWFRWTLPGVIRWLMRRGLRQHRDWWHIWRAMGWKRQRSHPPGGLVAAFLFSLFVVALLPAALFDVVLFPFSALFVSALFVVAHLLAALLLVALFFASCFGVWFFKVVPAVCHCDPPFISRSESTPAGRSRHQYSVNAAGPITLPLSTIARY
jgi:hypothetical protein